MLNPPAPRFTRAVLRDYYCSTYPKAGYYWHPIDLLAVAALLQKKGQIIIIDAVACGMNQRQVRQQVEEISPDAIFALVSSLTCQADLEFTETLVRDRERLVIGGEAALNPNFNFGAYPFVDGLLLDFTCRSAVEFLIGEAPAGRLRTRDHAPAEPVIGEKYSIGVVPHQQITRGEYRLPLWRGDFYSLLTDFGCPHDCPFCNSGKNSLGFKLRDLDELSEELKNLKQLNAHKIYLRDMTFGADPAHMESVLNLLTPYQFLLRGYMRADQITRDSAKRLKVAGFDMVQIGVERPTQAARRRLKKNISDDDLTETFRILREVKIKAGAHFVVGLAGDAPGVVRDCVQTAKHLQAAYCSINIYQHRLGTKSLPTCSAINQKRFSFCVNCAMKPYNFRSYLRFFFRK